MTLIRCADSASPGALTPFPDGFGAVQGYIGKRTPIKTPTPHIWGRKDFARFPDKWKYPMFVGTPAIGVPGHPETEAFECLHALWDVGAPPGCITGVDMETSEDSDYVNGFYDIIKWGGFKLWVYGSLSTVFSLPECDGYDVAHYTNVPELVTHPGVKATQYANAKMTGHPWDARVIRLWQAQHNMWK